MSEKKYFSSVPVQRLVHTINQILSYQPQIIHHYHLYSQVEVASLQTDTLESEQHALTITQQILSFFARPEIIDYRPKDLRF